MNVYDCRNVWHCPLIPLLPVAQVLPQPSDHPLVSQVGIRHLGRQTPVQGPGQPWTVRRVPNRQPPQEVGARATGVCRRGAWATGVRDGEAGHGINMHVRSRLTGVFGIDMCGRMWRCGPPTWGRPSGNSTWRRARSKCGTSRGVSQVRGGQNNDALETRCECLGRWPSLDIYPSNCPCPCPCLPRLNGPHRRADFPPLAGIHLGVRRRHPDSCHDGLGDERARGTGCGHAPGEGPGQDAICGALPLPWGFY